MALCLYILKCADDSYYTGVTNNLELRLDQHNIGWSTDSYTYSRRPVELVFYEVFLNYDLCIEWEKRIKGWSRAKKEALIKGNFQELIKLSSCKNQTHYGNYGRKTTAYANVQISAIGPPEPPCFDYAQHDGTQRLSARCVRAQHGGTVKQSARGVTLSVVEGRLSNQLN
jgi:putative endonuclease